MPWETTVDAATARAALADSVQQLTALIRSVRNPAARAVGEWNTGDVAMHLVNVWEALPALARGDLESPLKELSDLGDLTTAMVSSEADRDLGAAAARIDAAASAYLAAAITDDG